MDKDMILAVSDEIEEVVTFLESLRAVLNIPEANAGEFIGLTIAKLWLITDKVRLVVL